MNASRHGTARRSILTAAACAVFLEEFSGRGALQAAEFPAGRVRVVLADFPALGSVNGSAYINVAAAPPGIYPVVLTRTGLEEFAAVSSECAHNGCVVQPYSAGLGVIQCNCHGSRYTAQGVVVNGLAQRNLTAYSVSSANPGTVEIEIPGIGFALAGALVNTSVGRRMRLSFPTASALRYEIKRRTSMTTPATIVPFSLTEAGTASQTVLSGDGATVTLYLEADVGSGILSVARF